MSNKHKNKAPPYPEGFGGLRTQPMGRQDRLFRLRRIIIMYWVSGYWIRGQPIPPSAVRGLLLLFFPLQAVSLQVWVF